MNGEGLPSASHVSRAHVQLGTVPAPIDSEEWANCCMLYWLLPDIRKREFWQLQGTRADKQAFLLRYGHFEPWRKPQ